MQPHCDTKLPALQTLCLPMTSPPRPRTPSHAVALVQPLSRLQTHRAAHAKEARARDREDRVRRSQLEDLAAAETQRAQLAAVRLELERLRLLLERVSKRERLKREGELGRCCFNHSVSPDSWSSRAGAPQRKGDRFHLPFVIWQQSTMAVGTCCWSA